MDLKKLNEKLDQIKLEKETKEALLDVINEKISDDMKEVINAIGALKQEINTFDHKLDASIGALNVKLDASNSKIDNMKWFIGAAVAIAVGLARIFKLV